MGTTYSVKYYWPVAEQPVIAGDLLCNKVDSLLQDINSKMSTYIDTSELMIFNHSPGATWVSVSPELLEVINTALQVSGETEGAFDITVGPLVNLWGFGPEMRPVKIPSRLEIKKRKQWVGYHLLRTRETPPSLLKEVDSLYCDLSAIAKGYAVDRVADFLNDLGLTDYLVEVGGEIRARGNNLGGKLWKIGIATPSEEMGIQKVLPVVDRAVATSGDYRNYFEENGVRYSHTIDPKTGEPIKHHLASVTVVHASCMYADAYATAIDVMGPEKGYRFALEKELPVFLIVRENNRFVEKMTPQFEELLLLNKR
ncbi:MAG: FAD:protein FMN transferase [Calditrichia bacterium]